MADYVLSLTIPEAKLATALEGFLKIYPNVEIDGEDPKYTNAEWVREQIRRLIVRDVRRGLQMIANETANVASDDDLVQ